MKVVVAAAVGMVGLSSALASSERVVRFSGEIQKDNQFLGSFNVALMEGRSMGIDLDGGLRLEMRASSGSEDQAVSTVRLIGFSGSKSVVLHQSSLSGSAAANPAFAYSICKGRVTYASPAPLSPQPCT